MTDIFFFFFSAQNLHLKKKTKLVLTWKKWTYVTSPPLNQLPVQINGTPLLFCSRGERARITNDYNIMCGDNHSLLRYYRPLAKALGTGCMAAERQIGCCCSSRRSGPLRSEIIIIIKKKKPASMESWSLLIPALKYRAERTGLWWVHINDGMMKILVVKVWAQV